VLAKSKEKLLEYRRNLNIVENEDFYVFTKSPELTIVSQDVFDKIQDE